MSKGLKAPESGVKYQHLVLDEGWEELLKNYEQVPLPREESGTRSDFHVVYHLMESLKADKSGLSYVLLPNVDPYDLRNVSLFKAVGDRVPFHGMLENSDPIQGYQGYDAFDLTVDPSRVNYDFSPVIKFLIDAGRKFFLFPHMADRPEEQLRFEVWVKKELDERLPKASAKSPVAEGVEDVRGRFFEFFQRMLALDLRDIVVPRELVLGVPCECVNHLSAVDGNAQSGRRAYELYAAWERDSGGVRDSLILRRNEVGGLVHRACGEVFSSGEVERHRQKGLRLLQEQEEGPAVEQFERYYGPNGIFEDRFSVPGADAKIGFESAAGPLPDSFTKKLGCGA